MFHRCFYNFKLMSTIALNIVSCYTVSKYPSTDPCNRNCLSSVYPGFVGVCFGRLFSVFRHFGYHISLSICCGHVLFLFVDLLIFIYEVLVSFVFPSSCLVYRVLTHDLLIIHACDCTCMNSVKCFVEC